MTDIKPFPPHPVEITLLIASFLDFDSLQLFASTSRAFRTELKPKLLTCWKEAYSAQYSHSFRGRVVLRSIEEGGKPNKAVKLVSWLVWFLVVSDYHEGGIKKTLDLVFGEVGEGCTYRDIHANQVLIDMVELRKPQSKKGGKLARTYNILLEGPESELRDREEELVKELVGKDQDEVPTGEHGEYSEVVSHLEEDGLTDLEVFNVTLLKVLVDLKHLNVEYVVNYFLSTLFGTIMERYDDEDHSVADEQKLIEVGKLSIQKLPRASAVNFVCGYSATPTLTQKCNVASTILQTGYRSFFGWDDASEEEGMERMKLWFSRLQSAGASFDLALAHCFTDMYTDFEWVAGWIPLLLEYGADPNAIIPSPKNPIVTVEEHSWSPFHPPHTERSAIDLFRLFLDTEYSGIAFELQLPNGLVSEARVPMVYLAECYAIQKTEWKEDQIKAAECLDMLRALLEKRPGCLDLPQWDDVVLVAEEERLKDDSSLWDIVAAAQKAGGC
ncbi:hypothetical protein BJ508DRAFT_324483 [Ascobolus immersus RN42]|uniref:F-box domain-containing protein n=1 Tax=Ascobolus immersus RN42 TaxID=1160509 RepID=A0A3N4IBH6_ASCIM|nr:hypothetical protein BJ508DRAFT_324483 [Ascobolus immersus RN42]